MDISRRSVRLAHESDGVLVERARSGEDAAFGLLYLRHHQAAWRVANAVTAFSPRCEDAVVEAFTRVLDSDRRRDGDAALRVDLLACVRQVALERGIGGGTGPTQFPAAPDRRPVGSPNEVVLTDLEPLVAQAFRDLDEPERTALWLSDAEALTPTEVAGVMGLSRPQAAALAADGRLRLRQSLGRLFAACGPEACRRAAFQASGTGTGDRVRSDLAEHVSGCPICRMRSAEAGQLATSLWSVVPCPPLLGRPCQRRWRRNRLGWRRALPSGPTIFLLAAVVAITLAR
ncbi:MAG TPA: sigma-70 family RNA polymerase sigma factor [Acidimicrobiia bacterium]|nr:sigma-70 family RNA polymerase sigma factor [Acidimicrobiia bacterium]